MLSRRRFLNLIGLSSMAVMIPAKATESKSQAATDLGQSDAGSAKVYVHLQNEPSKTWTIKHNQGVVSVALDIRPNEGLGASSIVPIDGNTCLVKFDKPFSGRAYAIRPNLAPSIRS